MARYEEEATLEGEKYKGRFAANKTSRIFRGGADELYNHDENKFHWDGIGIVEDIKTREKYRFLFGTGWNASFKDSKLMTEGLVQIRDKYENLVLPRPTIINPWLVNNLVLEQIYRDAKAGEESEIIPFIGIEHLLYEELLERKLIIISQQLIEGI